MSERGKSILINWIVAFVFTGAYFLLFVFVPRNYTLQGWQNCFFLTGVMVVLTGGLQAVYYFGAFDMVQYGFQQIFHYMKPDPGPMKHKDFAEYRQYRAERRKRIPLHPWPWLLFGATFMLCSLIFRFQIQM